MHGMVQRQPAKARASMLPHVRQGQGMRSGVPHARLFAGQAIFATVASYDG